MPTPKFTKDQDEQLIAEVKVYKDAEKKINWRAIAWKGLQGAKDNTYISRRYQNILDPTLKKGPLANEEIVAALELYRDIEKTNDYPSIAKSMNHQQGQKSAIFSENAFCRVWIASALAKTKMRNSSLDRMKL